jgi:hypothetical protein
MASAGLIGACLDQWDHLGVSAWRSMCRSGALTWPAALSIQFSLLPGMFVAMLAMAVAQLGFAAWNASRNLALTLTCHVGCLLSMVACCNLGARLLWDGASTAAGLGLMLGLEVLISVALAVALSFALRGSGISGSLAHAGRRTRAK